MIVLNKKRIVFLISALMVSFICVSLNNTNNLETVPTSSVPATGHTIILDAGHRSTRWRSYKQ